MSAGNITYRTKDGRYDLKFKFVQRVNHVDIYCLAHPSLRGRDSDVNKTHIFSDRRLCFVAGREPRNIERAKQLAAQWAEYICEYIRTGIPQS